MNLVPSKLQCRLTLIGGTRIRLADVPESIIEDQSYFSWAIADEAIVNFEVEISAAEYMERHIRGSEHFVVFELANGGEILIPRDKILMIEFMELQDD